MPTSSLAPRLPTLRSTARAAAAAGALALSAFAIGAAAGPAWGAAVHQGDQFHFVLLSGDSSSTINASSLDQARAESLRGRGAGLLYFRDNGAAYVIRDTATLQRAHQLFEPQRLLGERQAALGQKQAELGRRQGELGAQQARIGALQADATVRQIAELGRQQAALGRDQAALGQQQAALGRDQGDLGREQARLGQVASDQLRSLVTDALRRGLAQRVN